MHILKVIDSFYGHDGFLIESEAIAKCLESILKRSTNSKREEAQSRG